MFTCHCCLLWSHVKIYESPNLARTHSVAIWCNRVQHWRALDRYCTVSLFRHETNYISKEHRSIWSTSLRAQTTSFFNDNRYFKSSPPVHRASFNISLNRTCDVTSQEAGIHVALSERCGQLSSKHSCVSANRHRRRRYWDWQPQKTQILTRSYFGFQTCAAAKSRPSLFRNVAQRKLVICYRHCYPTYQSDLRRSDMSSPPTTLLRANRGHLALW